MEREHFGRLEAILEAAWEAKDESQRRAVLDEMCGDDAELRREVERLIALDRSDEFLEDSPVGDLLGDLEADSAAPTLEAGEPGAFQVLVGPGTRIGSYEILEPLGEGGMGAVFLARRHDGVHHREVALKILATALTDGASRDRFRAEREILAHLSHPNIASLLDGGTTADGRPYLVMEWVDGVPVDRFCRREGLGIAARLELFVKVCAAVEVAHRSLIVHRDLKPANILVDADGEPKLLDFGIAKLLRPEEISAQEWVTATGSQPMTPAYASPEQVNGGQITTAVDVYALGILLFELLTGQRPYSLAGVPLVEAIRRICSVVPPKPSAQVLAAAEGAGAIEGLAESPSELQQVGRQLRGDLDAIVGMALRKEPERRYASAQSLREDVESHRSGHPVKAAHDTWSYRLVKFVSRNRSAVAATTVVFLMIVTFLGILLVQGERLKEERNRATFTSDFLLDIFIGADPWSVEARNLSTEEMLDRGREALAELEAGGDEKADLLHTIGAAYAGIGQFTKAEELLRSGLEARRLRGDGGGALAETMARLGEALRWQGRLDEGAQILEDAIELLTEEGLADSRQGVVALIQQANVLDTLGRYRDSEGTYDQAVAIARREDYVDLEAVALHRLGMAQRRLERYDSALALLQESFEVHLRAFGRRHPRTGQALTEVGAVLINRGDLEEATAVLREAEATQRSLLGDDHPERARVLNWQGQLALVKGDAGRAERLLGESTELLRRRVGDHVVLGDALRFQAILWVQTGYYGRAERAAEEALGLYRRLFGEQHVNTAYARHRLAMALSLQGESDLAREHITGALETLEALAGAESAPVAVVRTDFGKVEFDAGRFAASEAEFERALAIMERLDMPENLNRVQLHNNLASAYFVQGKAKAAELEYRRALEIGAKTLGPDAPYLGSLETNLARMLENAGRQEEASDALDRGLAIFERAGLKRDHLWWLHHHRIRSKVLMAAGRHAEVDAVLRPWLDILEARPELPTTELRWTVGLMVENLKRWGRPGEAEELKKRDPS
ncbi:MAG: tetratricopeptide repeat protein [Acidobacteriota bacterium]